EWSTEAARHEQLAAEARARGRQVTATEASLRAAIYYHYAKHLFADRPDEYRQAHERMLACYAAAAAGSAPPMERLEVPFERGGLRAAAEGVHRQLWTVRLLASAAGDAGLLAGDVPRAFRRGERRRGARPRAPALARGGGPADSLPAADRLRRRRPHHPAGG